MTFYGYNFTLRNSGGLGAIIHDVMNAAKYAEDNGLVLGLVSSGYDIPRLNGSIQDIDVPDKNWHSYFNSFNIVSQEECIEMWPKFLPNSNNAKWTIQQYSDMLKHKICTFRDDISNEINGLVTKTPFNAETDIVIHIRQTDKITECPQFLPIEKYIDECEYALSTLTHEKNRIYVCTDNKQVVTDIKLHFSTKNIEVVWDDSESADPLQAMRWNNKLPKSIAQNETMVAFKNIFIMKNAKYLIGGRMSYFYRIAELLGYPNKSVNIQDNDAFGVAPYSSVEHVVRPYMKNTIPHFVNKNMYAGQTLEKYNKVYMEEGIVTIPDFISLHVLSGLRKDIENYKWWSYATIPNNNKWDVEYSQNITKKQVDECNICCVNKQFTYRFRRCMGNHYSTCVCVSCKLNHTVKSFPFTDTLCKIIGCRNMRPGEVFISDYGKDDFLSIHHDKNKGDIAVTISLTYDWHPTYGGILHFCDENLNIFKSVVPRLGNINIFKLDPAHGLDHFVSAVTVDKHRYTLVAWYYLID
jgi:hypothetical protein